MTSGAKERQESGGRQGAGGAPDPHGDPARWAPRLQRLLDEQRSLATELETLARRQREHIAAGDTDRLLAVLGERQVVIDRLSRVVADFQPFRDHWEELMAALPPARRDAFAAATRDVAGAVERVGERDEEDRRELERRRAGVAAELSSVTRGRSAVAAYGRAPGAPGPRFQDREG